MNKAINRFPTGMVDVPPSKSVAHRALICAALARVRETPFADAATLAASVGLSLEAASDDLRATAEGIGKVAREWERGGEICCGESGSTLRFLIPVAAMTGGEWIFTGRERLLQRPMGIYAELFAAHGALFEQTVAENGGRIRVRGPLPVGDYELPGDVSSQFVTGLLLALSLARSDAARRVMSKILPTSALESRDYVNLTIDTMRAFGVWADETDTDMESTGASAGAAGCGYFVSAGQRYSAQADGFRVEGDWSQAAFFLCAGALGADVSVRGLDPGSRQGDRRVTEILERTGARIEWESGLVRALPPPAGALTGTMIDARDIPDIVPPLAALACFAAGETRFTGAERLRIKESDRLAALARELSKFGREVRETADGLVIQGVPAQSAVRETASDVIHADAHGDHRIAMAVAVAALASAQSVELSGAECVAKSYPDFWADFGKEERK